MKVVILAGGLGTRLSEETEILPKPMVEIGGKPILWHIMKIYSHYGFNEFVILLGYKGNIIKQYFQNYFLHQSDVTIDIQNNRVQVHSNFSEPWVITLVDTGLDTQTGGRILRARKYLDGAPFMLTYGDGVGNVDIHALIECHKKGQKILTLTAVQPEGRFGSLELDGTEVINFIEKPRGDGSWISGGFFVCEPGIFDTIKSGDKSVFERESMNELAHSRQISAFKHKGFWRPMDTLRDKHHLQDLWKNKKAPWRVWS
jgi:glucose-1-phosphate cytidylyltransferase